MKELKTPKQLVEHMRERGIKFNIVSEEEAEAFLTYNTYYKKLSSYKKNYVQTKVQGKKIYQNLEFAYLQELSKIDMYVRQYIMMLCLDIEHAVKVELNRCAVQNDKEDGYNIVKEFFNKYPDVERNISTHATNPFCYDLIIQNQRKYALCVLLEVISFGDLCKLYQFYEKIYPGSLEYTELLFDVRELRNAVAHNHCLLNDLTVGTAKARLPITNFIARIDGITPSQRKSRLSNYFIKDFVTTLYFFDHIEKSQGIKKNRYKELKALLEGRVLTNKTYFESNVPIKLTYCFCRSVVDKLINNEYNSNTN